MDKRYAFELSGEHQTLPESEVMALLPLYTQGWKVVERLAQCLIVEMESPDLAGLCRRLAMTHRIIEVLAICQANLPTIASALKEAELPQLRYRVRGKRIRDGLLSGYDLEVAVGTVLHGRGLKADLSRPEMEIRALVIGDRVVLGREVASIDRGAYEGRRPHLKPFFYPGVLMPRMARALVNLTQVREGEVVLDPFSGTGGILVEACLAGMKGVGVDIQSKLSRGSRSNVAGLDCSLLVGDARSLPLRDGSIPAVVTDTPYGRSALVRGRSRDGLVLECMEELKRVIREGGRLVIVADRPIGHLAEEAGFRIEEAHLDRVHRSLTRHILLCLE